MIEEPPQSVPIADTMPALRREMTAEIQLMLRFAWSRGLALPDELGEGLATLERPSSMDGGAPLAALASIHAGLTRAIAPALPVTLCLMDLQAHDRGWRSFMGPIANVRRLLGAAFTFLGLFVLLSLSPSLTVATMNADIYAADGLPQLVVLSFLLSAAGIGATFQALFTAQRYVADSNYDPRYDGSYWILIALGLVAGLLLSVLVPIQLSSASSPSMAKPLLALVGGFSSGLVYRILQRLVDTVDSLFQPRPAG